MQVFIYFKGNEYDTFPNVNLGTYLGALLRKKLLFQDEKDTGRSNFLEGVF